MIASNGIMLAQAASEAARKPFDWLGMSICAAGLALLMLWLKFYGGPQSLAATPIRRNAVSPGLPFLLFLLWFVLLAIANVAAAKLYGKDNNAALATAQNLVMLVLNLLMIGAIVVLARRLFARRLKGFGLNPKTLIKDAGWAAVNLAAVYPLIIGGIGLVFLIGWLIKGDSFSIATHQSLEELMASEQVWFRVLVIVLVVIVVPITEELLFRGLMQSALRALLPGAWSAILLTSLLFATAHYSTHMPSIFALSCGLGYAYERSGSLFRPIWIHIFFNGTSVAATLLI